MRQRQRCGSRGVCRFCLSAFHLRRAASSFLSSGCLSCLLLPCCPPGGVAAGRPFGSWAALHRNYVWSTSCYSSLGPIWFVCPCSFVSVTVLFRLATAFFPPAILLLLLKVKTSACSFPHLVRTEKGAPSFSFISTPPTVVALLGGYSLVCICFVSVGCSGLGAGVLTPPVAVIRLLLDVFAARARDVDWRFCCGRAREDISIDFKVLRARAYRGTIS